VELRCEADLDIANALLDVVPGKLVGRTFERLGILEDGTSEPKAREVLGQRGVVGLEDELVEAFDSLGRQSHAALAGHLDEAGFSQGAVEMNVEIGLR